MKIIKVETCTTCPYRSCHPVKDEIVRVPYCIHHDADRGNNLPFVLATKSIVATAAPTNNIPDWCPLEDDNTKTFVGVIEFAAATTETQSFLRCWMEGDWEAIRKEWPDFTLLDDQT